jgi:hypothetical protein
MSYRVPHEKLSIEWTKEAGNPVDSFTLSLPWVSMNIDVADTDKAWIQDATSHLCTNPQNSNVQRFVKELNEYLVSYVQTRTLEEFEGKDLQECPDLAIDASTPSSLLATFGCPIDPSLKDEIPDAWVWDHEKILSKARIEGTDLYDPIAFVSYLMCYRLEWESEGWTGQDGFGVFLEGLLKRDEPLFFQAIGWITKQAWYITSNFCQAMEPGLTHFSKAKELLQYYIADEAGHNKFMEQVFQELGLDKDDFPIEPGSEWLMASYKHAAAVSPLTFVAMINIFEVVYCDGQEEPTSRLLKLSSRPHAAHGYDLHYKINREHRHCDMPLNFAPYLAPQTRSHVLLALGVFELTSNFFDKMEQRLAKNLESC